MHVNVVDKADGSLVSSYLVSAHARMPRVMKEFAVTVNAASTSHKKISYFNPYSSTRRYHIRTRCVVLVQLLYSHAHIIYCALHRARPSSLA